MKEPDKKTNINYVGPEASMYWVCYALVRFLRKDINEIFSGLIATSITLGKPPACEEVIQEYLTTMGIEKKIQSKQRINFESINRKLNSSHE